MPRAAYPSDLTEAQWHQQAPLLPAVGRAPGPALDKGILHNSAVK